LTGENPSERFESFVDKLGDRAFALGILGSYPVLARQLVRRGEHWLASSLTFLRNLSQDWPAIRAVFAADADAGILTGVQPQMGDTHRRGRSVVVASFSSGLRILYKPRPLGVDRHFQQLLQWLNQVADWIGFRALAILDRGTHGWMEFISFAECEAADGVSRFYERQGGYLAILYLLNGVDFHCDNVIASGEHPALVDVEALFHGSSGAQVPAVFGVAGRCGQDSVLAAGLLPMPLRYLEGAGRVDRSGLAAGQAAKTPFGVLHAEGGGTDEMQLVRSRLPIKPTTHWPAVEGGRVERIDGDAVVRGFRTIYETFLGHREELRDAAGPIACFRNDEVRIILRHTLTYARMLAESFHPDVLRDAMDRDQMFDLLWGHVPERPHLWRVIAAECRDLWEGDVPIFTGRVGSRDLFTSTGERIADFLAEPSDEPVRRRIDGLCQGDLERQTWLIRASLATLSEGRVSLSRNAAAPIDWSGETLHGRLVAHARAIGDRLELLAARSGGQAGWMGLKLEGKDDWLLSPLGPDLYDGTAGIVLFLACLAAKTDEPRYRRLALEGLANLEQQMVSARGLGRSIGAFNGWGGLIYACTHLAQLLGRPELRDSATAMAADLVALVDEDSSHDVIGGAAGCIASLLVLHQSAPSDSILSAALRCGDKLIHSVCQTETGAAWLSPLNSLPLGGFSHGASGIAWALLRLADLTGETSFSQAAGQALQYERSLFDPATGNWADLRTRDESRASSSRMSAWCHGAAGIGLSRLSWLAHDDADMARCEIVHAVRTTLAYGFGDNHSLCHGDLGNLDFVFQASKALGRAAWSAAAQDITAMVLDDIEENGWKCGIAKPVETSGLMLGLAGIGYGMLRLAAPDLTPSVLTLEPPAGSSPLPTASRE
jgi:type 2 lantibiotic biosynthesis protein LanM